MWRYLKNGWTASIHQPFLFVTLFVYRLAWGFALYSLAQSVVVPLLHRYPGKAVSLSQSGLFWAEGQFQLLKTDISHSYLWLLLGLLAARMVLTPLLNAGVFYSLRHTELNAGYRFVSGIRTLAKACIGYYAVQMVLTLAPLYFLYPLATHSLLYKPSYEAMAMQVLPVLLGWLVYAHLLRVVFLHLQLGKAWDRGAWGSLGLVLRGLLPVLGVTISVALTALLLGSMVVTAAMLWAGFWALVLVQGYRLVDTLVCLWGIAAQHELHTAKLR